MVSLRNEGNDTALDFQHFAPFRFRLYQVSICLRGKPCVDVHPGFSRRQLSRLLSKHLFEEICYRRLREKWRTSPFQAAAFLLRARRVGRPLRAAEKRLRSEADERWRVSLAGRATGLRNELAALLHCRS